jgi:hypothetical protein
LNKEEYRNTSIGIWTTKNTGKHQKLEFNGL